MKKLLALLLTGAMAFSITACGGEKPADTSTDSDAAAGAGENAAAEQRRV